MDVKEIFGDLPTLETDRLILRKMAINDAEDMFEYASDPEVAIYVRWEHHKSIEDTIKFLESTIKKQEEKEPTGWGIILKENGKLIGACGFLNWIPVHNRSEVGYVLSKKYWNQGIMTEALNAVIEFGFEEMGLNRIEGMTRVENDASQKVLKKAGMTYEGTIRDEIFLKGQYRDFTMYSILKREYQEK